MIIPTFNHAQLDFYVIYRLKNRETFDFAVPRSTTSYTAYLLKNIETWTCSKHTFHIPKNYPLRYASEKLLLILKKYMLYYAHQGQKTAKDYRQLLTITDPLTNEDQEFCHLFVRYNEKLHGPRPADTNEFAMKLHKDEFFRLEEDEKVSCAYQTAKELSIGGDLLIGLEYICTKSPPWLADFVIEHWMEIHSEKFNNSIQMLPSPVIQKILLNITDLLDFHSMKLVCKRWYTILNQPSFWQNLYITRYGHLLDDTVKWKSMYMMKLSYGDVTDETRFNQLVDATLSLRRFTVNDVVQLWEDFTHQNQCVDPDVLMQLDDILSHSYYSDLSGAGHFYSANLILIGFDHPRSRSKITVDLRVGEYGSSYFTNHMEELTVRFEEKARAYHPLSFMGPELFGFRIAERFYCHGRDTRLSNAPSFLCPRFPEGLVHCLFIIMVHPSHRAEFINYLMSRESYCVNYGLD